MDQYTNIDVDLNLSIIGQQSDLLFKIDVLWWFTITWCLLEISILLAGFALINSQENRQAGYYCGKEFLQFLRLYLVLN